jgi:hypothetical protein
MSASGPAELPQRVDLGRSQRSEPDCLRIARASQIIGPDGLLPTNRVPVHLILERVFTSDPNMLVANLLNFAAGTDTPSPD